MASEVVYLLPELIGEGGNSLFPSAVQVNVNPVKVPGFKLYTFLRRLNNQGFSTYCVAIESPSKSCIMYPIHFNPDDIPFFESNGFITTPTPQGIVIHISHPTFDVLDKKDKAVSVKSGDWLREKERFNQIAAMHYLGIIPEFSPAIFKNTELFNNWSNKLHQSYGTYGDLSVALNDIFRRSLFAINFFCVSPVMPLLNKITINKVDYFFATLYDDLKNSYEIDTMKNILPNCSDIDSPYNVLYVALKVSFKCLNMVKYPSPSPEDPNDSAPKRYPVTSLDDTNGFIDAIRRFQEATNMQEGCCDVKTLRKLISTTDVQRYSELPIFKMAGIDIKIRDEPDFPMIKKLERPEKDPLAELVRTEINNAIVAIPDPAAKIEWMNAEIENTFSECDERCQELSLRVDQIEKQISEMSRQLKDVVEESKTASRKVSSAAKTLEDVYTAHNKIQGKFDILRDKLYAEQRNTQLTLIISIFLTLLGVFSFRY